MSDLNPKSKSRDDAVLFEHLIDGIKDYAIFMVNLQGRIVTWNPGVERLLGYSELEFVDKAFSEIFNEQDQKANVPGNELKTAQKTGKAEDERWHKKKDGSLFWANGLVTLIKQDGKEIGFAKIMRDQTQKKRFEEQLAQQASALAAANKELSNFAGVLSHDLNAPLQTVFGFANILKAQEGLDPEGAESVQQIVDGTKRMMKLVHELLQYCVVSKSEQNIKFVDSSVLLEDVLKGLLSSIKASKASIEVSDLPSLWVDATQLGRVLQNLIENSIKYAAADRDPIIKISASETEKETVFSVEDNGRGIEEHQIGRLFTLYDRLDVESDIPGKGIGLATCKKIVERFGGKIWVQSVLNQGSKFFFSIPSRVNKNYQLSAKESEHGQANL